VVGRGGWVVECLRQLGGKGLEGKELKKIVIPKLKRITREGRIDLLRLSESVLIREFGEGV